jgi:hypothetical protein
MTQEIIVTREEMLMVISQIIIVEVTLLKKILHLRQTNQGTLSL